MKKTVAIFLFLLYGFTTLGATVHLHYCMNTFVGWSLWHGKEDNKCGKCGMKEKKGGCCKDEHKQFKLKTDHQKSATAPYIQFLEAPALVTPPAAFSFKITSVSLHFPVSNGPPKIPKQRLYLLHGIFLI